MSRRQFIENIAWELFKPQIEFRSMITKLPVELWLRAHAFIGIENTSILIENPSMYVGLCYVCPRYKNKSNRRFCNQCQWYACKEHMKDICSFCLNL